MAESVSPLPRWFCWTRFGTEAGDTIEAILARKEAERQSNGGMFLWGIGNSVAPAVLELLRRVAEPEVLFSPIKSRPRRADVAPPCTVRWTRAVGLSGDEFELPAEAHVTSRWDPERPSASHYALVCASPDPLELGDKGRLSFGALRNLRSGTRLGASQVTAVVDRTDADDGQAEYPVALRAALIAPHFVRLRDPIPLENPGRAVGTQPAHLEP